MSENPCVLSVPTEHIWLSARSNGCADGLTPIVVFLLPALLIYLSKAVYRMGTGTSQMFDYRQSHFRAVNFGKIAS